MLILFAALGAFQRFTFRQTILVEDAPRRDFRLDGSGRFVRQHSWCRRSEVWQVPLGAARGLLDQAAKRVHQAVIEANFNALAFCRIKRQLEGVTFQTYIAFDCEIGRGAERKLARRFGSGFAKRRFEIGLAHRFFVLEGKHFAARFGGGCFHRYFRFNRLYQHRPKRTHKAAREKNTKFLLRRGRQTEQQAVFDRVKRNLKLVDRHAAYVNLPVVPVKIRALENRP